MTTNQLNCEAQPVAEYGTAYAELPDAPLPVFSKGPWTFKETGQNFSGAELDEAAFVAYRDRTPQGQAPAQADPAADTKTKHERTRDVLDRMQRQEDGHNKNPFGPLLERLMANSGCYSVTEIGQLKWALDGFYGTSPKAAPAAGAVAGLGWKLVPVEPTDDMLRAIRNQRSGGRIGVGDRADWAAWLAAAPTTQPAPQQGTPLMPKGDSAAPKLRAMATNYPAGNLWDKLDAQACIRGALEIEALRAAAPSPAVQGDELSQAASDVLAEVERATRKFPTWPTDPLHALAVLGEEFGELTKDMLQLTYEPHKTNAANVRTEALQTAAMALRLFMSLDRYEYRPGAQHSQYAARKQGASHDHT